MINNEELTLSEKKASLFAAAFDNMIATSSQSYARAKGYYRSRISAINYTDDQIKEIIREGSFEAIKNLSKQYFYTNSFYRQAILTYACMPLYYYVVIPILRDKPLAKTKKKYLSALDLMDSLGAPVFSRWAAFKVLLEGVYYGFYAERGDQVATVDLPTEYSRSLFKGFDGLPIVEIDLKYFTTITDSKERESLFKKFPKELKRSYQAYLSGKGDQWYAFDEGVGIYLNLYDDRPYFLSSISSIDAFADYQDLEIKKEEMELKKILIQKLPLSKLDELIFEGPEMEELHRGALEMLKNNDKMDVLTTYADANVVSVAETRQAIGNNLENFKKNMYSALGISPNLFAAEGNLSLERSLQKDESIMFSLLEQLSASFSYMLSKKLGDPNHRFSVRMLPITHYNLKNYMADASKMATLGYSFLLPAISLGVNQKEFIHLKTLENDILKLDEILIPLQTSYTQTGEEGGRPAKAEENKTEKTISNGGE